MPGATVTTSRVITSSTYHRFMAASSRSRYLHLTTLGANRPDPLAPSAGDLRRRPVSAARGRVNRPGAASTGGCAAGPAALSNTQAPLTRRPSTVTVPSSARPRPRAPRRRRAPRSPRDALRRELAGDEHHRYADPRLGTGDDEDHVRQSTVEGRGSERSGLEKRMRGGERRTGGHPGRRPGGRGP